MGFNSAFKGLSSDYTALIGRTAEDRMSTMWNKSGNVRIT